MTTVVHCRQKDYDVYIGRPSKWGNPFTHLAKHHTLAKYQVKNRAEAVEKYREWILTQSHLLNDLASLKDKVLGCWCKPQACHGDVLAEMANKL